MKGHATQSATLGLLLAMQVMGPARATESNEGPYDCATAAALPDDADEESRRLACEIPEKYQHDVGLAQYIGRQIRLHDMAAWLTTDALVAIKAFDGATDEEGRGWLTDSRGSGIAVRYFVEREGTVQAIATATLSIDPFKAIGARKLSPPEPLSDREARLMRAKSVALASDGLTLCTNNEPNTVAFEFEEDGKTEILVFVMSAWAGEAAPLGGYHMIRVSADGSSVLSHFSQTQACPMADAKNLKDTAALMVSHANSAAPTMFHVFMNLQYRKPLYVTTTQNHLLWRVDQGRIFQVEDDKAAMASPKPGTSQEMPAASQDHTSQ